MTPIKLRRMTLRDLHVAKAVNIAIIPAYTGMMVLIFTYPPTFT
jgi:hypothetical protein